MTGQASSGIRPTLKSITGLCVLHESLLVFFFIDTVCVLNIMARMKILLCGMGNRERGDDAFGPYVIDHICETETIRTIDCALSLENHLNQIIAHRPDLIILFDTVQQNGKKAILLTDEEILNNATISVSTHNAPFSSIYEYMKENSHASIWLYGVRPQSYEHLTQKTIDSAKRVIDFFNSLDNKNKINIIDLYETLSTTLK